MNRCGDRTDETTFIPSCWTDDASGASVTYTGYHSDWRPGPVEVERPWKFGEAIRIGERFGPEPDSSAPHLGQVGPDRLAVVPRRHAPRPWTGRNYRRTT